MGCVWNMGTINYCLLSNNRGYIDSYIYNICNISSFRVEIAIMSCSSKDD